MVHLLFEHFAFVSFSLQAQSLHANLWAALKFQDMLIVNSLGTDVLPL